MPSSLAAAVRLKRVFSSASSIASFSTRSRCSCSGKPDSSAAACLAGSRRRELQFLLFDLSARAQRQRALEDVLEFAHIAGKLHSPATRPARPATTALRCRRPGRTLAQNLAREHRDVLAHLAQRRHPQLDHVEAVIQVLPELAVLARHRARWWWVALMMRTSTFSSLVAPTLRTFFSWIARNNLTCIWIGRSATSSRNSVPPLAAWKKPSLSLLGAGERALLVAEEFAFHQILGNRAAIDRHERRVAARPLQVHQARRELLAAAGFAADVDRRLAARQLVDHLPRLLHQRATRRAAPGNRRPRPPGRRLCAARSSRGNFSAERTSARNCSSDTGLAR